MFKQHFYFLFVGIIHWEILPRGKSINSEVYCQQLGRLQAALREKRPHKQHVVFLHDNASPHRSLATKAKLAQLGWEILPHPPYSPDLSPTDFKVFRSLQNWLNGKDFVTELAVRDSIQQWMDSKPPGFWVEGISDLPNRWSLV